MQRYYDPTVAPSGAFYCDEVHKNIPATAKKISAALFDSLQGFEIEPGPGGVPRRKVAPEPTLQERAAVMLAKVDLFMDGKAKERGYDNITKAALRAALPDSPYHAEGLAYGHWMDAVYAKCYEVMAMVELNQIPEPTEAELIAMLPTLALPERSE